MLDPREKFAVLHNLYEQPEEEHIKALIIGGKGSGKTTLLRTCPRPVLLDMWEPFGEQSLLSNDGALPEWLAVRKWGKKDLKKWANGLAETSKLMEELGGTYALDPITDWSDALIESISPGVGPTLPLWGKYVNEVMMYMKVILSLPCHVIMLGHYQRDIAKESGKLVYKILIPTSAADKAPLPWGEYYHLECFEGEEPTFKCADGLCRRLVTRNNGTFKCTSRLGRNGRVGLYERADIAAILKKTVPNFGGLGE